MSGFEYEDWNCGGAKGHRGGQRHGGGAGREPGAFPPEDHHGHGRPPFGPGFGFGPGFMAGMGFGPGRRRGPGRGRRGDVRNAVLALLSEQPMNGYQIIQAISERSDGLWRPGAGSVYPALGLLSDEGLIQETEADGKPAHELTDAGRAWIAAHADEVKDPWEKVSGPHRGFLDVGPEVARLGMAVQQVAVSGDSTQIEAARKILSTARRDIYRLLAGDLTAEDSDDDEDDESDDAGQE